MRAVLSRVVLAVAPVGGVVAVALGPSAARGREVEGSDLDVGLSYRGSAGLDVDGLRTAVATLDPRPEVEVTRLGEWGEWVNGGAWLAVGGRRVDLLYRDLDRIEHHLAEALAGRVAVGYQVGHPHAVTGASLLGEAALARVLHDPTGALTALRAALDPYPSALADAMVRRFGSEARFSLEIATKGASRGDVAYVVGCLWRGLACTLQAAFAGAGCWLLNEKGALAEAVAFGVVDVDWATEVEAVLAAPGATPEALASSLAGARRLLDALT